jgi:hypothetical protein
MDEDWDADGADFWNIPIWGQLRRSPPDEHTNGR